MNIIRFIGDVHSNYRQYKRILKSSPYPSIQLGDLGMGFIRHRVRDYGSEDIHWFPNPPFYVMIKGPHEFIRGNHDHPSVCKRQRLWIPDGTVRGDMMFIGGAASGTKDRESRTEGYDWWPDEELSISELNMMVDIYNVTKPRIMVTHDCPTIVAALLAVHRGFYKLETGQRTREALQAMFELHQPKIWIGGHWHVSFRQIINDTKFICLNELEWIDMDLDSLTIMNEGSGWV